MNLDTYFFAKIPLGALPWLQPESCLSLVGGTLLSSPEHSLCAYNWLTNHIPPSPPTSKHNMCLQHDSHRLFPVGMPFLSLPPNLPLNLSAILFAFFLSYPTSSPPRNQVDFNIPPSEYTHNLSRTHSLCCPLSLILALASNVAPCFFLCPPTHP